MGKGPDKLRVRWVREVQGVLALGVAAYLAVALLAYDPGLHGFSREGQVGVVGLWVGWALFAAIGYAGYLVPLTVAAWGIAASRVWGTVRRISKSAHETGSAEGLLKEVKIRQGKAVIFTAFGPGGRRNWST